jgi:site-specific DNA-methyltransferase (adenine-specific)
MIELNHKSACSKTLLPLVVGGLTITCEDNMELMARYPDNYFDLAIVDPPYGIDLANMNMGIGKTKKASKAKNRKWKSKDWDNATPTKEYFNELFRVSKNQIIWGGNYFDLPPCKKFIMWDKEIPDGLSFSDCEMAWTSFSGANKIFRYSAYKNKSEKFHPTQKPPQLYKYCIDKYTEENYKILDTHLGSGSIAIACHDYKVQLTACELDPEYFEKAKERIINHVAQQSLF